MIDPLYRPWSELPGTGTPVEFAGVAAEVDVTDTPSDVVDAQWMDDREVTLTVTDDVAPEAFARLLPGFAAHAAALADRSTTAAFALPSRDVVRGRLAREAGFAPVSVLAVADLRRFARVESGRAGRAGTAGPVAATIGVRDAVPGDAGGLGNLWCEQAEYEAAIGTLRTSRAIESAIRDKAAVCIAGPSTVLVAELPDDAGGAGGLAGAVVAETPADSVWSGARLTIAPTSYLSMASTAAAVRSRGVGAELVTELHRRHREAGIAASTLYYTSCNPLSVPFWSQRGYRPVVTIHALRVRL